MRRLHAYSVLSAVALAFVSGSAFAGHHDSTYRQGHMNQRTGHNSLRQQAINGAIEHRAVAIDRDDSQALAYKDDSGYSMPSRTESYSRSESRPSSDSSTTYESRDSRASRAFVEPALIATERSDSSKDSLKTALAPEAVSIHTDLQNAMEHLRGIRETLNTSDRFRSGQLSSFKNHSRDLNSDLRRAESREGQFDSRLRSYPDVAQGEDYRSFSTAFSDLKRLNRDWQLKAARSSYWRDRSAVRNDLDAMEKQLSMALDRTENFSAKALDFSSFS